MGTITVNVDDETETLFRNTVSTEYGKGKGVLGKAITEAMKRWAEEKKIAETRKRALAMLEKGFDLKGIASKFNRQEFYDEVIKRRTGY
jgi:hypothetical protein